MEYLGAESGVGLQTHDATVQLQGSVDWVAGVSFKLCNDSDGAILFR